MVAFDRPICISALFYAIFSAHGDCKIEARGSDICFDFVNAVSKLKLHNPHTG